MKKLLIVLLILFTSTAFAEEVFHEIPLNGKLITSEDPTTIGNNFQTLTNLRPTDTGEVVSSFLEDNFGTYISDTFTAEMEDKLDAIANGEILYEKTLSNFYKPFLKEVKEKEKLDKATTLGEAPAEMKCPKCGSKMVIKLGRSGKFLSCARYPDCDGALMIDGTEMPKDKIIGLHPDTGNEIVLKSGKYGPYVETMPKEQSAEVATDIATDTSTNTPTDKPKKSRKKKATAPKPRRASVPKEINPDNVTLEMALHYLSLPRKLGDHPETGSD